MSRTTKKYMGTLVQRPGRPGWYWRCQIGGKRFRRFAALTKRDAAKVAEKLTSKYLTGSDDEAEPIAFEEFVETHLEQLEREHAATTYADEENRFQNVIGPFFKGMDVDQVGAADVERFLSAKTKSAATRNRFLSLLSRFFERAIAHGHAKENPTKAIRRTKEAEHAVPVLSLDEQDSLLAVAGERVHDLVLLALDTGMRESEMLRLEWSAVDLERGTITIRQTKNKHPRIVSMTGRLRDLLEAKRKGRTIPAEGPDYVLAELGGKWSGHSVRLFKRAVKAAGFPDLRVHDLRHVHATTLAQNGLPLPDIAGRLGHSSMTTTYRYAKHLPQNADERARDLLEAAMAVHKAETAKKAEPGEVKAS